MNSYITLETIKNPSVLDVRDTGADARLLSLIESASRAIDGYCRRHFYLLRATRLFDGDGSANLRTPDLVSIDANGLSTDDDRDGVFETAWGSGRFETYPYVSTLPTPIPPAATIRRVPTGASTRARTFTETENSRPAPALFGLPASGDSGAGSGPPLRPSQARWTTFAPR